MVQLYKTLNKLPQGYWKDQKLKETKDLIEAASGLWVEAFTSQQYAVQGDSIRINFVLNDRMGAGVKLYRINFESFDSTINLNVEKNRNFLFHKPIPITSTK